MLINASESKIIYIIYIIYSYLASLASKILDVQSIIQGPISGRFQRVIFLNRTFYMYIYIFFFFMCEHFKLKVAKPARYKLEKGRKVRTVYI